LTGKIQLNIKAGASPEDAPGSGTGLMNLVKRIAEIDYVRAASADKADLILTFYLNLILIFVFGISA